METPEKHFVSNSRESTRMFQNNFLEAMSKMHFTLPLFIYVPVISYFIYDTVIQHRVGFVLSVLLILSGAFLWTLVEYITHRFLFHYKPDSKFGKRLHFIFHGVHHDYPNDAKRLVMAPAVSIPLAIIYYTVFRFMLGEYLVAPFFTGFVLGYLFYDMSHYAIHHLSINNGIWMKIKKHHMIHHYKDSNHGYGVSSTLWDVFFGTGFEDGENPSKE
jgi:sterol desaturase/sphingolipid hydroxylase (fatty acid hydroxylase superfamily)